MSAGVLPAGIAAVLADDRRRLYGRMVPATAGMVVLASAFAYGGAFDLHRYAEALPTILQLAADAMPPDFSRWHAWGRPLLETLAMSVAGTALAVAAALPLSCLAARTVVPQVWLGGPVRLAGNAIRSIPGLIWGVIYVAAVGFGPLPGILALATHSTGMLAKLFAEILEHVDPAPGNAPRSHGVCHLGVLRFAVLPQVLPRLADVTPYQWEHNLRAATTLGVVGAGGLGLEIVTAFHLSEYREATALIIVVLGLVTGINLAGGYLRRRFVGRGN